MGLRKIFSILLVLFMASSAIYSSTLARFTDEYAGADTALVAKWNFSARGQDDPDGEFFNKGFTFDLFDNRRVKPMDYGEKSFTFTGGGSDVGIAYDVEMNVRDLLLPVKGTVAQEVCDHVYPPFIFKISAEINDGATDDPPVVFSPDGNEDGWFRPMDISTDQDGYFSIFNEDAAIPTFSVGSTDQVTVTVAWQWNTSFYINETDTAHVTPNPSWEIAKKYLPYYQVAHDQYYGDGGLHDRRKAASRAVDDFLDEHGSPASDGTWESACPLSDTEHEEEYWSLDEEGREDYLLAHGGYTDEETGELSWAPHNVDNYIEYNRLVKREEKAIEACERSLLAAYDDYDTLAVDALDKKESVQVIFRIKGDQIAPQ